MGWFILKILALLLLAILAVAALMLAAVTLLAFVHGVGAGMVAFTAISVAYGAAVATKIFIAPVFQVH